MYTYYIKYEKWNNEDINFTSPCECGMARKEEKIRSFGKLLNKIKEYNNWLFWSSTNVGKDDWLQSEPVKVKNGVKVYSLYVLNNGQRLSFKEILEIDKLCKYKITRET